MPAIARATLWATRTGSPLRGTATVSAPTTTASRSAISTTTVASGADADARISNHDRGRVTTSPVSVPAAAVTTSTRDDGHHDGCTTTARLPGTQVSARSGGAPQRRDRHRALTDQRHRVVYRVQRGGDDRLVGRSVCLATQLPDRAGSGFDDRAV